MLVRTACLGLAAFGMRLPVFAQEPRFVRIGTGAIGGTYFPVGGLIANAISNPPGSMECEYGGSCGVRGLIATAVSTQGSVENASLVAEGKLDLALCQADVAYHAFTGSGTFAGQLAKTNLRVIANLFPEVLHAVVARESGITTIKQLRGKRMNLGDPDSGTLVAVKHVLGAYSLRIDQIKASYDALGRASDLLVDKQIDGFFMMGGYPMNAIADAATKIPLRLLPIDGPAVETLLKTQTYFTVGSIPSGVYQNVDGVDTIAIGAQIIVRADLDEAFVQDVTRALWDPKNRNILDSGHPNGRQIRIETALKGLTIPLHPGAERYYVTAGLVGSGP
ncbi:MAG: TAXI family TRAP transporter solute-binding subunit [Hyphomicrobiales bacterium]|nr:TAXI family TRAP transporter solute-binding subunit [Hyphomicrobiales bacterium]